MLSYIINDENRPVPVEQSKSIGKSAFTESRSGDLAPQTTDIVLTTTEPTIVDYLEFACNSITGQLIMRTRIGTDYQPIGIILADGSGTSGLRPDVIIENGCGFLSVNAYDTAKNAYKFSTKGQLYFPNGVQIGVLSTAQSTTIKAGVRFNGRVLK